MRTVIALLCTERCLLIPLISPILQAATVAGYSFPFLGFGLDESSSLKMT